MQQYPSQTQMLQPPPQRGNQARPQAHTQRSSKTYPAPCIKYTDARSTSSVWGGSTIQDSDDSDNDDETVAAFTTTSIASSHSRAPGNNAKQQRRVTSWVDDTSHYSSKFKSPFVPPSGMTSKVSSSSAHTYKKTDHHPSNNDHRGREREPPPIWVPRHTVPGPLRHAASQPVFFQQPPVQYPPPQPVHYAQPPPAMWMPASPPPQGVMRTNGHVQFVPPPRTITVAHVVSSTSKTMRSTHRCI
ncbi:hypothetical protein B0H12DRAFT_1103177 [Mycena haematopus]|nr:hypothetical protein B0H12DRAFT_1103177 [Mycena haematopus]